MKSAQEADPYRAYIRSLEKDNTAWRVLKGVALVLMLVVVAIAWRERQGGTFSRASSSPGSMTSNLELLRK
ncbi:MAG TPA: hypothetical protein PKC67_07550 [Kiritimatiellia bacterium]|nr:hypothetical protein [Kiritimatiellia bacterium]HMP34193.1 hypothetical protein [Kiritimatiellia bacterium]